MQVIVTKRRFLSNYVLRDWYDEEDRSQRTSEDKSRSETNYLQNERDRSDTMLTVEHHLYRVDQKMKYKPTRAIIYTLSLTINRRLTRTVH